MKYTTAQHDATAALASDIAARWGLPDKWHTSGRLATHEDISPLTRSHKGGGWDPGVLRGSPWFDWHYFVERVATSDVNS
jgi:N-acetyl-anhydromuramyl-L-alanine amidase AmpD